MQSSSEQLSKTRGGDTDSFGKVSGSSLMFMGGDEDKDGTPADEGDAFM
jgi:hypothetical protein